MKTNTKKQLPFLGSALSLNVAFGSMPIWDFCTNDRFARRTSKFHQMEGRRQPWQLEGEGSGNAWSVRELRQHILSDHPEDPLCKPVAASLTGCHRETCVLNTMLG